MARVIGKSGPRLRLKGIRTSLRRVLRLMREHDLLAPSRTGSPRGPRNHDGTIIPDTVDTLWGTDMTTGWTSEGPAAVFVAVDHHSAECVGIHASRQATRFEALEPLRQGCASTLAALARELPQACRSGTTMAASPCREHSRTSCGSLGSRVRPLSCGRRKGTAVPSASSARSRRTCCGCAETIEELRQALLAFRESYNSTWLIARHGFQTPEAVRHKQLPSAALAA
jgi:putative transposase